MVGRRGDGGKGGQVGKKVSSLFRDRSHAKIGVEAWALKGRFCLVW